MVTKTINFGDYVKDIVTEFEGTVTGRCEYITGCDQVLLQPTVGEDGKIRGGQWFDIDRVEVVEYGKHKIAMTVPGPDMEAPKK